MENSNLISELHQLYKDLFNKSPLPKWVCDRRTLQFYAVNEAAEKLYGYTREEFLQRTIYDLRPIEDHEAIRKFAQQDDLTTRSLSLRRHIKKDGSIIWVEISLDEMNFKGKDALLIAINDVTEKLQAEERLQQSEALYRSLFNNSPDFIWVTDAANLQYLEVNDTALAAYGYSREEFLSMTVFDLLLPEDRDILTMRLQTHHAKQLNYVDRHVKKNGEIIHLEIKIHIIDYKGKKAGLVMGQDITQKMKAEEALRKSETRFRSLIEKSHDGITLVSAEGKIIYTTPSVQRILGYTEDELKEYEPVALMHPDDFTAFISTLQELILSEHETKTSEYRLLHKNGEWRWLQANITNMLHTPGVEAFVINFEDITKRKLAEQKLLESEANMGAILQNTNTAFYLLDTSFRIVAFNNLSYEWTLAETGKQLQKGAIYSDYIKGERKAALLEQYQKAIRGEDVSFEVNGYNLNNYYHVNIKRITDLRNNVIGICISSVDITQQKIAEEKLRNSESLYRSLFDKSPLPVFVIDKENLRYLEVNDMACEMYGYTKEEFCQLTIFDIRVEEDHDYLRRLIANGDINSYKSYHVWNIKKNRERIIVDVTLENINYKGREAYLAIVKDITKTLQLQKELNDERVNKQIAITRATISGQEKERNELGRELHDNVNQILASAKLYLETSQDLPHKQAEFVENSKELIMKAINEIRRLSKSLVPPTLGDLTLKEALVELVNPIKVSQKKLMLQLKTLHEKKLCNDLKISIYRIVQEQLNNILKYAGASEIGIQILQTNERVVLLVTDNGKGFNVNMKRSGIGITNIINRASLFNGTVNIESSPGNGCRMMVEFILPATEEINRKPSLLCKQ